MAVFLVAYIDVFTTLCISRFFFSGYHYVRFHQRQKVFSARIIEFYCLIFAQFEGEQSLLLFDVIFSAIENIQIFYNF